MGVKRLVFLVASLCLCAVSPAQARDRVIAHDATIRSIYALGGDLVYSRGADGAWMRWVGGKLTKASGIPRDGGASAIGRDAKGRTVLTFALSGKWYVYDLASDRARPLGGLPAECAVDEVTLWRGSMAYSLHCDDEAKSGVFVKQGERTQKVEGASIFEPWVFRDGSLAAIVDDGLDNAYIDQYLANGKPCLKRVDSSFGDATDTNPWYPSDLWLGSDSLTWVMGHSWSRPNFAVLSAKLPSGCAAPGPVGQFQFKPPVKVLEAVAVDGRRLFYADGKALRVHALPPKPSYRAPRNDDFEHAKRLPRGAPVAVTGNVAHATVQHGEPLADAKHTVWYAFRPEESGPVEVSVPGACAQSAFVCNGAYRYGVYTGDEVAKLSRIAPSGGTTRIDAVAGERYWIAVGAARPAPKYEPFELRIEQASSPDGVVAHDTLIRRVYALHGDLVYSRWRGGVAPPSRNWMRFVGGKLSRARAIPARAYAGAMGRDAQGRKVFTFGSPPATPYAGGKKWFAYDLARDRARPLHGLPAKCIASWVSVWRRSMAYDVSCKKGSKSGVFVRQGKRTRRIDSDPGGSELVFQGGAMEGIFDTGLDDFVITQHMANGKVCNKVIDSSYGDATPYPDGWYPTGLWLGDGHMTWTMGNWGASPGMTILTAKLPSTCAVPGPIGELPFSPETDTIRALTVDGRRAYYADDSTLRVQTLPATPSYAPPPNDDFEDAVQLQGDAPVSATGRAAYATVQPGEPLARAKHTIWYAFRPTKSGPVYISASGGLISNFEEGHYVSTSTYGVYTGSSLESLKQLPYDGQGRWVHVDAVAGETYWIAVGSPVPEPNYGPLRVSVTLAPP